MFKVGFVTGVIGLIAVLIGGGVIVYSQMSGGSGADIAQRAFEAAKTPHFLPVVARVNGREILGEWLDIRVAMNAESLKAMPELAEVQAPVTPREILDSLINFELAYQEAERRGLLCSDQEVRSLAEQQIQQFEQATGTAGGDYLKVWADHLGTTASELTTNPQVLAAYARGCARGRLFTALAPPEAQASPETINTLSVTSDSLPSGQFWHELYASLRQSATIEILDPSLQ